MKKIWLGVALLIFTAVGILFFLPKTTAETQQYLRIHIRANSNSQQDQGIKLAVKDKVVEYLIPLLANATTKAAAQEILSKNLDGIAQTAAGALAQDGFLYGAQAEIANEEFPARKYAETTLPAGAYDALILKLGTGDGDNWWCVAFPPLCFTPKKGTKNIVYRSKIIEIIENWKEQHG